MGRLPSSPLRQQDRFACRHRRGAMTQDLCPDGGRSRRSIVARVTPHAPTAAPRQQCERGRKIRRVGVASPRSPMRVPPAPGRHRLTQSRERRRQVRQRQCHVTVLVPEAVLPDEVLVRARGEPAHRCRGNLEYDGQFRQRNCDKRVVHAEHTFPDRGGAIVFLSRGGDVPRLASTNARLWT